MARKKAQPNKQAITAAKQRTTFMRNLVAATQAANDPSYAEALSIEAEFLKHRKISRSQYTLLRQLAIRYNRDVFFQHNYIPVAQSNSNVVINTYADVPFDIAFTMKLVFGLQASEVVSAVRSYWDFVNNSIYRTSNSNRKHRQITRMCFLEVAGGLYHYHCAIVRPTYDPAIMKCDRAIVEDADKFMSFLQEAWQGKLGDNSVRRFKEANGYRNDIETIWDKERWLDYISKDATIGAAQDWCPYTSFIEDVYKPKTMANVLKELADLKKLTSIRKQ